MAAGNDGEERNLPPTERRLSRLRQDGQVPRSKDFETTLVLICLLVYLVMSWEEIWQRLKISFLVFDASMPLGFAQETANSYNSLIRILQEILLPIFAIAIGANIIAMILDAKGLPLNFKAISLNFKKLNPVEGFKNMFSLKILFELLKGIVAIIVVLTANYYLVRYFLNDLMWSPSCGESCVVTVMLWLFGSSIVIGLIVLILLAAVDFPISRILFRRDNKMTLTELKREQKEDSGDPHIRAERRRIAETLAQTAGYTGLSKADLLLSFGDHAIAITFRQGETAAPIIAAKTRSNAAEFIKEAALRKLPIVEEPELVLTLLEGGSVGDYIPQTTFNDVARILIQTGVVKL